MTKSREPINGRATEGGAVFVEEAESLALARRAMEVLDRVGRLLDALSPSEIESIASRIRPDLAAGDQHAASWRIFRARHRVLRAVFAAQRDGFARIVHTCVGKGT
jgi:hypothetical protein